MEKVFQIPSPRDLRLKKMAMRLAERALATHVPVDQLTKHEELIAASRAHFEFLKGETADAVKTTVDTAKNPDVEFEIEGCRLEVSKLYKEGRMLNMEQARAYCNELNAQLPPEEKAKRPWRLPNLQDLELMKQNGSKFKESEWILGYDGSFPCSWLVLQPSTGNISRIICHATYSIRCVR